MRSSLWHCTAMWLPRPRPCPDVLPLPLSSSGVSLSVHHSPVHSPFGTSAAAQAVRLSFSGGPVPPPCVDLSWSLRTIVFCVLQHPPPLVPPPSHLPLPFPSVIPRPLPPQLDSVAEYYVPRRGLPIHPPVREVLSRLSFRHVKL